MLAVSKPSSRSLRKRLGQLGRLLLALYLLRKLPTILRRYWPTRQVSDLAVVGVEGEISTTELTGLAGPFGSLVA